MTEAAIVEHQYLTVKELADLLRLKERKVYDLAASGEVPCSRATGKLLFPAADIQAWIDGASSGRRAEAPDRPAIALGSHDPLLDWAIRQSRCGLATFFDGSLDGLDRFARAKGVVTGLHVHDPESGDWNVPAATRVAGHENAVLIAFATRSRGLVCGDDVAPERLADLAGLRVVPRQTESGTDGLFRHLAATEGLDLETVDFAEVARTEDEAVESVRRGEADVAFGLASVARSYGLRFVPVIEEEFALLVDRRAWFEPPMQALLAFCAQPEFRRRAESYGGYDIGNLGKVLWNA